MVVPKSYIELAGRLADTSAKIIEHYFRSLADIDEKSDETPITLADRESEVAMRELIHSQFPDHGIIGEEGKAVFENAEFVWVLDPIDGTKNYACGSYNFGTLISLIHNRQFLLGIINQPILRERWLGIRGEPTLFNGRLAQTRKCSTLGDAWMFATSPSMFQRGDEARFEELANCVKHSLFGTDCIGYALLASGFTDIVCEATLHPWDYAALIPVIEGAGGVITDWSGQPLNMDSDGKVLACGDKNLHAAALNKLQKIIIE
ncbi:MAG: inositol monophosphatase family protein [Pseudomonadota bacterium]|nr:inositol monophosphatase family protein [Pseudomonadota bacterium]